MPVVELLTGLALIKSSVDFIKKNIDTINDISDIAGQIDGAFAGRRDCQKSKQKDKGMSIKQQFGSDSPAAAVIDAKIAEENFAELRLLIVDRFNIKVWDEIVLAQQEKVKQDKADALALSAAKAESKEQMAEVAVIMASIGIALLICTGVVLTMWAMGN